MRFHHIIILFLCFLFGLGVGYVMLGEAQIPKQEENITSTAQRAPEWRKGYSGNAANGEANLLISAPPLSHTIERILKKDPSLDLEETIEQLLASKDNPEKIREALVLLFTRWAEVDLDGALKRVELMEPTYFLHFIKHALFTKMINKNPREAALYYEKNKVALYGHKYYFLPDLARQWVRQAPEQAWSWLLSLPEEDDDTIESMDAFFAGLVTAPDTKGKYLDIIIADEHLRSNLYISGIINNWAKHDFKNTVNWLESSNKKGTESFWREAVTGGAEHDFDLATSYLPKVQEEFLPDVLSSLSYIVQREQGSETALNWMIERMPEGSDYLDFQILSDWSKEDPENAKKWLLQFTPEDQEWRDKALEAYVNSSNDPNHKETLKMAQAINNQELQKDTLKSALRKWKKDDRAAARQWVNEFEGTEEIKKSLKKIVD